ncbi:glycosyltransferase [Sphingosinicellaceae bacterium]|nr:glycosyltransferase [Sphingosinicellaceae bacterium]
MPQQFPFVKIAFDHQTFASQVHGGVSRDAAAFIYPSLYEGFGIPPLEAMAAGTPVVAVDAGSVPEVCGDAVAYAPPGDVEALRIAIECVVGSPTLTASLVAAGHARLGLFSWARCAAETATIYRNLL